VLRDLEGHPVLHGDDDGGPDHGAVWILFIPEPDPTLLLVSAMGVLIVLYRIRRLRRVRWR
jgi:hypothetical protein